MRLPAVEERVARRAKLPPHGLRVTSGHRSDLLPLRLEALDQLRGLVPGGGLCEARDLRAQAPLLLEVLGEIRVGTLAQLVARGTETLPEALRFVCRRARDGGPFLPK